MGKMERQQIWRHGGYILRLEAVIPFRQDKVLFMYPCGCADELKQLCFSQGIAAMNPQIH